jgi:hypothetical protein
VKEAVFVEMSDFAEVSELATPQPPLRRKRQQHSSTSSDNTPSSHFLKRTKVSLLSPEGVFTSPCSLKDTKSSNMKETSISFSPTPSEEDMIEASGRVCDSQNTATKEVTLEDVMNKLCKNSDTLDSMSKVVEEFRAALFDLKVDNDKMKEELEKSKKREQALSEELTEAKFSASLALHKVNELEQYTRRNNVRIFGVSEEGENDKSEGEHHSDQVCEKKVLQMLTKKLKVPVKSEDLEAVHRVGKVEGREGPRALIVRFVNRKKRQEVISARKALKGSGVVIVDDMTRTNIQTFEAVKRDDLCKEAWTSQGRIYMKTVTERIVRVETQSQLKDPKKRSLWASELPRRSVSSASASGSRRPNKKN